MAESNQQTEPCLAVLTPPGRAAIATLAVFGPSAWPIVRAVFRPLRDAPEQAAAGQFWFGKLGDEAHGFDEVVVAVKQAEPIACVEVHCHGGPEVVQMLRELFRTRGVHECSWQEFVQRMNADRLQAKAACALAQACTLRTASILLDQYHGAFAAAVAEIATALHSLFPSLLEGDGPGIRSELPRNDSARPDIAAKLNALLQYCAVGRHLTVPWRVAIAGAPNAGKSSLVNALAGYERSIVSPISGTTRDLVTTVIAVDGWPVELIDTAGIRGEAESLEREGIALARAAAAQADLCLWLLDSSATPVFPEHVNVQLVVNKIDLPAAWDFTGIAAPRISVRSGAGLDELRQHIAARLVPNVPPPGTAVPFTPELSAAVERAHANWLAGAIAETLAVLAPLVG